MTRLRPWHPLSLICLAAFLTLAGSGSPSRAQSGAEFSAGGGIVANPAFPGISLHDQTVDLSQSAWPPSPSGAVGPNHVVEIQNQSMAIFTRTGTRLSHVRLRDFLSLTLRGTTYRASFDPVVLFDARSRRWFMACVASGGVSAGTGDPVLLAVSRTDDPTGAWSKFVVSLGEAPVGSDFKATGGLTMGVDAVGVYFGVRIFPTKSAEFCKLAATPKAPLLAGRGTLGKVTQFPPITGVLSSPQVASNLTTTVTTGPAWAVGTPSGNNSGLRWWKITWSRNTPSLSASGLLPTDSFGDLPDAAQNGSAVPIEAGDARALSAVIRNGHLWTCRTIGVNSSGGASSANRTACEWFDLDVEGAAPALAQTGRIFDGNSSPRSYYFPTLSVNSADDAVISFCGSRASEFIGAYFAGRLHTDAAGTMSPVETLKSGDATYERTVGGNLMPFGRHGAVSVDPEDDFSFWSVQPYAADTATDNSWGTWIGRIQLSEPPIPPGKAQVAPLVLRFGKVKVGRTATRSFTLTSRGDHPLVGTVATPAAPYSLTAGGGQFRLARNQKLRVMVKFTPTAPGAVPPTAVEITTNDPAKPRISINLTAAGK